jgi:predicted outer membrane repeat protein
MTYSGAFRLAVSTLLFLVLTVSANATTLNVPSGSYPTIQSGVSAATPGDTVLVACGTYNERDIIMTSGIVLRSQTGEADCATIHAMGMGRVLECDSLQAETKIEGFTITGGAVMGPEPYTRGGGIYIRYSIVTVTNCDFVENIAFYEGGGLWCTNSQLMLTDCNFMGNNAQTGIGGGAACGQTVPMSVTGCSFIENSSGDDGGGMFCTDCSALITSCYFYDNTSMTSSGGLDCRGPNYQVSDCVFDYNSASYSGGGVSLYGASGSTFHFCTFSNNSAGTEGGGVYCGNYSAPLFKYCTFADNSAPSGGGIAIGWDSNPSTAGFENTIIAFSSQGEAVYCDPNCAATLVCSDVYGNAGGDYVGCIAGQGTTNSNFSADPLFCRSENPTDPYTIRPSSPCTAANSPCGTLVGAHDVGCSDRKKRIDQEQICWDATTALTTWPPGLVQSFKPTVHTLDAVQLLLGSSTPGVPADVLMAIYDELPDDQTTPLAWTMMSVSPPDIAGYPEWFQFHFPQTLRTIPGYTYYIAVQQAPLAGTIHWWHCSNDDNYTRGTAWENPAYGYVVQPNPPYDFAFKTEYYGLLKLIDQQQTQWTDSTFVDLVQWPPGQVQSFTPSVDVLDAIKVLLAAGYEDTTRIEVCIYDQLPNSPATPIASTIMTIQPPLIGAPEWFQFHFDETISLIPEDMYYLSVKELTYQWNVHWCFHFEVPVDLYTRGTAWVCPSSGVVAPPTDWGYPALFDFVFKTEYFGFVCGDVDASGDVDIDDVVYLIAYIFSGGPEPDPYEAGDADCSVGVDIDDVVYLIAYIFSGGPEPCNPDGIGEPDC